jgi:hypothetical protein
MLSIGIRGQEIYDAIAAGELTVCRKGTRRCVPIKMLSREFARRGKGRATTAAIDTRDAIFKTRQAIGGVTNAQLADAKIAPLPGLEMKNAFWVRKPLAKRSEVPRLVTPFASRVELFAHAMRRFSIFLRRLHLLIAYTKIDIH